MLLGLFFLHPSPMLILLAVLAAPHLLSTLRGSGPQSPQYYEVPAQVRINYAFWYLGLTAILGVLTFEIHNVLQPQ